jgi:CheY-like chemotaxis protein
MQPLDREHVNPSAEPCLVANGERKVEPTGDEVGLLVVTADRFVRSMVQVALERRGFVVWSAANGRIAIDVCREHRNEFALALLDAHMPGLDGPATLEALRNLHPQLLACFMIGDNGEYEPDELIRRGAAYVIAKPFRLDRLANILRLLSRGVPAELIPSN